MRRSRAAIGALAVAALAAGVAVGAGTGGEPPVPVLVGRAPAEPAPRFEDVAARSGIALPHQVAGCSGNVAGAAWADVEADGDLDLYLPQHAGAGRLWIGDGRGRFQDVAEIAGVADVPGATGATFADYDDDGDPDLYVLAFGVNRLFQNQGDGTFRDVTEATGVGDAGPGTSAAWGDYDRDGDLDLYVVNGDNCRAPRPAPDRLYRNTGQGRFDDVSGLLGRGAGDGVGLQAAWIDLDGDGDLDLYVANDHLGFRGDGLWRNDGPGPGDWRFTPVPGGLEASSMGLGLGDLTADGRPDLVVSDIGPPWLLSLPGNRRSRDSNAGRLTRARFPGGREETGWGVAVEDFDNDGDEDAFVAGGALGLRTERRPDRLYLGDGHGRFRSAGRAAGRWKPGRGRGVATADVNRDGLLDLLVGRLGEPPALLLNRGPARGAWLELELRGTRSAADACGTRVTVTGGGRRHVRWLSCGSEGLGSSGEGIVHVGLGPVRDHDGIVIAWPSGTIQRLAPGRANTRLEVIEPASSTRPDEVRRRARYAAPALRHPPRAPR